MLELDSIRGMFVPVPTPLDGEGELDESLYSLLVDYYIEKGANALFVFGSFGLGAAMDVRARQRGLEVALEAAAGRVMVVPDVGAVDPYRSRELAVHARAAGVGAIASVGPYYYTDRSPWELAAHFGMIDDAVELPLILYNNTAYQGYAIPSRVIALIRDRVPRLIGSIQADGSGVAEVAKLTADLGADFKIFAPALNMVPGLLAGQTGTVNPPLTLATELGVALVRAVDRDDISRAVQLQLALIGFLGRISELREWKRSVFLQGLRHLGFDVKQYPRWPAPELPDAMRAELAACIDAARGAAAAA